MLELLAPAGDLQSFNAAINNGADAIYLGLSNFNARLKAENFTTENIGEIVKKAHFFGVKVYVTINTILQNNEFNDLISLVKVAVESNVDAYIVQDLGVVKVLTELFPGITLHASTQMGIHNLYGAKVAESLGIKRVVLSRETKLEDIKEIKNNTNLEIEYFVQGALCVCFSGNCYLSAVEQNASGNRGLCKQLCRLPYEAELKGEKYKGFLLSAKDLCLVNDLKNLVDAGVTSFKIEGRMRRPGYVATTVSIYRKYLNDLNKKLSKEDVNALEKSFTRGEYLYGSYLQDGTPFVVEKEYGNHIGVSIGKVKQVKEFKEDLYEVQVFSNVELHNNDGLKFFDKNKEVASLGIGECKRVNKGIYSFITKVKVKPYWEVRLILDNEGESKLLSNTKFVPVQIKAKANVGEKLIIECFAEGKSIISQSENVLEQAINAPLSEDALKDQCSKVGDSGFVVVSCDVETNGVFIAKSVLNSVRRDAISKLKEEIILDRSVAIKYVDKNIDIVENNPKHAPAQIVNEETRYIKGNEKIVFAPSDYSTNIISRQLAIFGLAADKIALQLPIIANKKDLCVIEDTISKLGIKNLVAENIYGLYFANNGYNVIAGAGLNAGNAYAIDLLKQLGAKAISPSIEYKEQKSSSLPIIDVEKEIPLMTFAHCPYKTLFGNECNKCSYKEGLTIKRENKHYNVRRIRVGQCYFQLWN